MIHFRQTVCHYDSFHTQLDSSIRDFQFDSVGEYISDAKQHFLADQDTLPNSPTLVLMVKMMLPSICTVTFLRLLALYSFL